MRFAGALIAALALPCAAGAEEGDPLAEARGLLVDLEFDRARETLTAVVEGGGLSPEQLAGAYRSLAECYAALRMPDEAQQAFATVLAIDPEHYVSSDQSPLVREPFEEALRAARDAERPGIVYDPPARASCDEPFVARAAITEGSVEGLAAEVTLHLRSGGGLYVTYVGVDGVIEVGAEDLEGLEELAFYLELRDQHGNAVTRMGSPTEPVVVPIGEGGGGGEVRVFGARPWYEAWWLWTAVGVVVVGLAVGLPLGLTLGSGQGRCEQALGVPCDITASIQ